ncbi:MAG: sigma-70 family RNA polymerase sigma factor [Planctomycetes bacterium]|nr:sigma-70 family RNA polymerase sigma factor [Planctomycetota bacterium]
MERDLAAEIAAARRGEPHAVDSLFARNLPPLVAFIRARAGKAIAARESAHDIAQSVFREVLQDVDQIKLEGEGAFRNWLFQQATRKVLDRAKFHGRERRDVAREQAIPEAGPAADAILACYASIATPSRHAAAKEELQRFEAAVQDLPENQRDALTMSRLMGLSYEQIAAQMGTTESAVRGLVARGLAALSSALDDEG